MNQILCGSLNTNPGGPRVPVLPHVSPLAPQGGGSSWTPPERGLMLQGAAGKCWDYTPLIPGLHRAGREDGECAGGTPAPPTPTAPGPPKSSPERGGHLSSPHPSIQPFPGARQEDRGGSGGSRGDPGGIQGAPGVTRAPNPPQLLGQAWGGGFTPRGCPVGSRCHLRGR